MYSVNFTGAEEFGQGVQKSSDRLKEEIMAALQKTADFAASNAKGSSLFKNHSFRLMSSIEAKTFGGSRVFRAEVKAKAPYAQFVEEGTRPHVIEARRRTTMRFVQNGAVRFARIVHHPGTKATHFMAHAQERATPLLERLMAEAFARAFTTT